MGARAGWGAGLALAFALHGCGGGPPDDVPLVRTGGGSRILTQSTGSQITSGQRLGNAATTPTSQSGTAPIAGTGNDLTGAAGFVGLSGSATKRARILSRLAADGISADRLTCPIGLPGVIGKEPGAIAIAVLAQLLSLRNPA